MIEIEAKENRQAKHYDCGNHAKFRMQQNQVYNIQYSSTNTTITVTIR